MKLSQFVISFSLYILASGLMASCAESSYVASTISFDPKEKPRSVFETGIIRDVQLVKLESDSCIVGRIDKIICNDSLLYMLDRSITKEVFIFTRDGRFIRKISKQGHGKYEYTQLWDIFFDKSNNALCLLSRYDQKIISFTPDGNKVLGETNLPKMFGHIVPTNNGFIGYMNNYSQNPNMPNNIWTMDKSFNLLDGYIRIDPQLESTSHLDVNTMSVYGDATYFKPEYENTIYEIKDGKISERYKLDFGEKTFPDLSTVSCNNKEEWSKLVMEKITNIYNYEETDDYILAEFVLDGQIRLGIYNKHHHTSEITRLNCYKGKYLFSFGKIRGMDQSAIYSVVDYEDIYELWIGHNKYVDFERSHPKQVENIRKRFPHMEEDGNPFIAIYSLK